MFTIRTIDAATRDQIIGPPTDEERAKASALGLDAEGIRDDRIIALVSQLPLGVDEIATCVALQESTDDFRRQRNAYFAAAWLARPVIQDTPREQARLVRQVVAVTGNTDPVELTLELIRLRMSAERVPRLEARIQQLQNPN